MHELFRVIFIIYLSTFITSFRMSATGRINFLLHRIASRRPVNNCRFFTSTLRMSSLAPVDSEGISQKLVDYYSIANSDAITYGDFDIIASQSTSTNRQYIPVDSINRGLLDKNTWIRGRISSKRVKGNACFVIIRSSMATVQVCYFADKSNPEQSKQMIKFIDQLTLESFVDIYGTISAAKVKSCTQNDVEIQIRKIFAISRGPSVLPFQLDDAARSIQDIETSLTSDRPFSFVPQVMFSPIR